MLTKNGETLCLHESPASGRAEGKPENSALIRRSSRVCADRLNRPAIRIKAANPCAKLRQIFRCIYLIKDRGRIFFSAVRADCLSLI